MAIRIAKKRLGFESLESRRVLATFTVNADIDEVVSGPTTAVTGSLRQMVRNANSTPGPDTIIFAPSLAGQTITLGRDAQNNLIPQLQGANGELVISDSVTITGLGAEELTINAGDGTDGVFGTGDGHRVFQIVGNSDVTLTGLTLTGGDVSLAA
ncbi:hypothetical protein MalM25_27790 [Planctomycetes bacterium MalM25]|nr:hypothetical protein MalM25_27790 [Planctomycetes bacterium MalM25]